MPHALVTAAWLALFAGAHADTRIDPNVFRSKLTGYTSHLSGALDIDGLLLGARSGPGPLFARQQYVCPDPAGQSCSATKCCPSGENCVSKDHRFQSKKYARNQPDNADICFR